MLNRKLALKKIKAKLAQIDVLNAEISGLRSELSANCLHEDTYEIKKADDNGYGNWWFTYYKVCRICDYREHIRSEDYK